MTQKTNQNPWQMDVRVRERNLKSGALTDKELEKQLAALPDLGDQAEPFGTPQPALAPPPVAVEAAPVEDVIGEDEPEDDEEDEEDEEEAIAAAPEPPPAPPAPPEPAPAAIAAAPEPPPAPPAPQVEEPAPVADTGAVTDGEGEPS